MKNKKYLSYIVAICFIFSTVMLAEIVSLSYGHHIWERNLAAESWNDEFSYYKQIEAIIDYGYPCGYYGYNGSHAEILSFGPWSLLILLPYALLGKIIGWNFLSPILCNLFFMTAAWAIFYYLKKPSTTVMIGIIILQISIPILVRYSFSGMSEALTYSILIILLGCYYHLEEKQSKRVFWIAVFLASYLSAMRPYYILILIIFLGRYIKYYIHLKRNRIGISLMIVTVTGAFYAFIYAKMCSPYFSSIIGGRGIFVAIKGRYFVRYIIKMMMDGFCSVSEYIKDAIHGITYQDHHLIGKWYSDFLFILILLLIVYCREYFKNRNEKRENNKKNVQWLILFVVSYYIVILIAIIFLYSVPVGARHVLGLILIGSMIILMDSDSRTIKGILFVGILMMELFLGRGDEFRSLQWRTTDDADMSEAFAEVMEMEEGISWANTVTWVMDTDWHLCYWLPSGFGIQISTPDLVNSDSGLGAYRAKYLLTSPEGEVAALLQVRGELPLMQGDGYALYYNPDYER